MSFSIEKARPEDAAALIDYLNQVGGETDNLTFGAGEFPATVEGEAEFIRQKDQDPKELLLVAREEGRIIGNASLSALPRRMSHRASVGVSVLREHWGRGIATALMEKIIAHAREQGIEVIELEVRSDNPSAIHLYEKLGFQKIGHYPKFFKIGDVYASFDLMNLYL